MNRSARTRSAGLLVFALASAVRAQGPTPPPGEPSRTPLAQGGWAIVGATVIPMAGDNVIADGTVLVRDGRVVAVGARAQVTVPAGTRVIEGRGRWVIPGLADMHAHLYSDEFLPESVAPAELGVMLAHGVTAARLMIGTPQQRTLRQAVRAGRVAGPQLWIASPQLSGDEGVNTWRVRTPDEARRAVRMARDSSYDFLKLTTNVPRDVYDAIVDAARGARLQVTGHVDPRVGVARALEARQQIEHLDNYMESVLADSAPTRVSVSDVGAYRVANWNTLDYVDERKVEAIAGATARAGIFVTPTVAFFRLWFATQFTDAEVRARPDYGFIAPRMRELYERGRQRYWQSPPDARLRARYIAVRNRMVKAIVDSGGRIMAGSDAPGGLMAYGWTMHRELAHLVDAGLTPMQALASATRVPAEWLGASREWGMIAPGRRADLVLLEGDPLADIRNTSRIAAVSVGGQWHDRAALDAMIEHARPQIGAPLPQDDRSQVLAVIQQMFEGMRTRDSVRMLSAFASGARLVGMRPAPDGGTRIQELTAENFVAFMMRDTRPRWTERLWNPDVKVSGTLATVWGEYDFHFGTTFSHCGVDSIHLLKTSAGWRITGIADTYVTSGCERRSPPPPA